MADYDIRPGEIAASVDPGETAEDARLMFIGRIRSPWRTRDDCPKNLRLARERGQPARIEIDPPWREGLRGLDQHRRIVVLYWMHRARRDLIVQKPRHSDRLHGVFSLRSPVRPNPIALAVVQLLDLNIPEGEIGIDAIDCLDGTPVLDIKPYTPTVDFVPESA